MIAKPESRHRAYISGCLIGNFGQGVERAAEALLLIGLRRRVKARTVPTERQSMA